MDDKSSPVNISKYSISIAVYLLGYYLTYHGFRFTISFVFLIFFRDELEKMKDNIKKIEKQNEGMGTSTLEWLNSKFR